MAVEEDHLRLTLKSLSVTRWSCRWEAVKAVIEQQERIVKNKNVEAVGGKERQDLR